MSRLCPQCGAENRDAAKFCLKCAHQLVPLSEPTQPLPLEQPARKRRRRKRPAEAPPRKRHAWLWGLVALVAVVALGGALWRGDTRPDTAPPQAAATPAGAAASSSPAAVEPASPASTASAAPPPLPAASSAPIPSASSAAPAAPARPSTAARRSKPSPPAAELGASVPAEVAPPAAAAPPEPVASAPARPAPPRELCADTRFLNRAVCLQNECSKPGLRQHPQCVQMREQQDALRRGAGDH